MLNRFDSFFCAQSGFSVGNCICFISQDYVGETPIHKAAREGSLECIKALLTWGAIAE